MSASSPTPFGRFLQAAPLTEDPMDLAAAWADQTVTLRLHGGARLNRPDLAGHLRRSFLGALGPGASPQARDGLACPQDPPCALDVFRREQFRDDRGNGLPKPYVIFAETRADDLLVSLRVFGAANDWFATASSAFEEGMRAILPWQKRFHRPMPDISSRRLEQVQGLALPPAGERVTLELLGPADTSGIRKPGAVLERSLLARLVRRVNALGHWHGLRLSSACTRTLTAVLEAVDYSASDLVRDTYCSPNRLGQNRRNPCVRGRLRISGPVGPILPILAIGERCHIGRAAREGIGRFRLVPPAGQDSAEILQ